MNEPPRQRRFNASRTRPARRRRTPPQPNPVREQRERKRLSRWVMITGVLAGISVIAGALLSRSNQPEAVVVPPPVAALRAADPSVYTLVDVRHVLDGDTLDVNAAATRLRVRLFGVDAPETGEPCAGEATERLRALAGDAVRLRADTRQQDRFGRELRYVYTPDGGSIDATLVAEGLALAWRVDGTLRDELVALEDEAREAGRGCLWTDE